ncbi:MAG TPA: Ig domain-containing protein, partial [Chthoniobacteraceae bacterium]
RSFVVPSGSHTLRWIYRKDAQAAEGQDRGWVDTVTLGPLQKPVITSSPAVASQVGVPFTYLIAAENSPTSYAVVGALPAGLGLDSATGVISGTPTSPGNFNITMKAISQIGTGTAALRISVAAAVVAIADAVDAPGLMWSTGGDGPWFGQIATTYDIADAAQSADIADAQQTWIETTAQGPSTVTFRWKVDSEAGFDFLRFTIDGVEQTAISGETDWRQESFLVPAGSHTLRWNYVKDAGASFGADKGWVDTVIVTTAVVPVVTNSRNATGRVGNAVDFRINATNEPTVYGVTGDLPPGLTVNTVTGVITGVPAREGTYNITLTAANDAGTGTKEVVFFVEPSLISIAQAVDSTTAAWTTGGDTPWFGQNAVAHDGVDAAQSGRIAHSEESTLVTQITGPTVIRFSWRVSSEQDFDVLAFLIDETVQSTLSGITGWVQRTFSIPEGTHTLKWRYRKDSSVSAGDDSAWLDRVSTGSTTIPVITSAGQVSATVEQPFNYQTVATNSPTGYSASGLPVGLVLNTSSGRITGTPEALGRSEVTLNASNVNGTGSITLIIDVVPPVPAITSVQTTQAQLATPFNYQITATLNPTSFGAIGLPPGLQLDPDTGLITGTPTVKGTFQVTLSATNADGTGTRTLLIAIGASVPVLTFERSPEGEVGVPFSLWLSASSNPLGFSVSGLPVGLRLDGATGVISGVPVVAGTYEITATANNRNGIGTLAFQINIAPADPQMLVGSDTFTSPGELRGASVTITDNNSDATAEESEPAHSGNAPAKSLWWRWTAPLAGPVRISTVGSTFDTVLAVYQEQEWGLMLVTANDNASAGLTSSAAQFTAAKGQAYLIAVDGVAGAIGDVNLSIRYEATATYAGILSVPGKSSLPAGAISVTTTADGSFTGRVALNRGNASFKGQFGVDGKATVTATGKGQTLPVSLALDVTTGTSTLGSSVNFGGETYAAIAQRSGFSLSVPTTLVGDHTLLMEPASAGSGRPFSTGFAVMKIESTGRVTLVGTLADGVRFSQSTVLADDGTFPLFAAPYRSGGAISGSVALGESPRRALSGALHWLKKPDSARNATYSSGFEMQSRLAGGAYVSVAPVLNLGGFGTISFLASNLAVPPPQQIALSIENKVRTSSGAGYPMKIDAKRGLFSGSFTSGGGKRSFKGAFLQGEQRAAGLFISNGATGVVNLVPSAAPASLKP